MDRLTLGQQQLSTLEASVALLQPLPANKQMTLIVLFNKGTALARFG